MNRTQTCTVALEARWQRVWGWSSPHANAVRRHFRVRIEGEVPSDAPRAEWETALRVLRLLRSRDAVDSWCAVHDDAARAIVRSLEAKAALQPEVRGSTKRRDCVLDAARELSTWRMGASVPTVSAACDLLNDCVSALRQAASLCVDVDDGEHSSYWRELSAKADAMVARDREDGHGGRQ